MQIAQQSPKYKTQENGNNYFQHPRGNHSNRVKKYIKDASPRGSTILNSLSRIANALLYCLNWKGARYYNKHPLINKSHPDP